MTELRDQNRTVRQLPTGWRWVKLSDVCRIVAGSTPDSGTPEYWGGSIVWVTPTDLGRLGGGYVAASERRITKAGYDSCGTESVPPGSVVMSTRAPIGHLAISGIALCTNQGCKAFVPSPGTLDSAFLYYALKNSVPLLKSIGSGATFAEVSKSQLNGFHVPLPPLPEQKRIGSILHEQLSAVEKARKACEEQLEAAKVLPAAYLRSMFDSPEAQKWPKKRLGDLLSLRNEIIHPHDNPAGSAVFVGLEHVETLTGRRLGEEKLEMSELTGRKPRYYKGDIVYGYLRPYLNKLWVAEFDGLCSVDQYVYSVRPDIANTNFVAWFMRSPTYLERAPTDNSPGQLPRIRKDEVAGVQVGVPDLDVQKRMSKEIEHDMGGLAGLTAGLESQMDALLKLPSAMLRKAFNGEL